MLNGQNALNNCQRCLLLTEQAQHRIVVVNAENGQNLWEWKPEISNVKAEHVKWFSHPSDAKVVYNGDYILTCASGGGVALVRMRDKKAVFYAYARGNTHSIELLPDGNIVSASSTGNYLSVFAVDTLHFPENVYQKNLFTPSGHNVVWDRTKNLLWSAGMNTLYSYRYNFNCRQPQISLTDSVVFKPTRTEAHDLFPVYGQKQLWLTDLANVYTFDTHSEALKQINAPAHVKSISSHSNGLETILTHPKQSWWTDEVQTIEGKRVYYQEGLKIYKARWFITNPFSYPETHSLRVCTH